MTRREALKASSEFNEWSEIPKPPSLAGSANSFLSTSFGGGRPVKLGMNSVLRMSFKHLQVRTNERGCTAEVRLPDREYRRQRRRVAG